MSKSGGGILPLGGISEQNGGHKGYGYGMLCELFCSVLSQGLTSNHTHIGGKGGTCHGFIAINPSVFGNAEEIKKHFSNFLNELRNSPKAEGAERIYTHGEKEIEAMQDRLANGILINSGTIAEMADLSDYLGIDISAYLNEDIKNLKHKDSTYN